MYLQRDAKAPGNHQVSLPSIVTPTSGHYTLFQFVITSSVVIPERYARAPPRTLRRRFCCFYISPRSSVSARRLPFSSVLINSQEP